MLMYQVLLVDDEPSITASLMKSVNWSAFQCTVAAIASNGAQAFSIVQKQQIDIVITDIRMQQIGGLELCQLLYTQYPHIQIIVISGYAEFSYAQKAINYGILGYCLKPLEYEEIGVYLRQAVSRLQKASQKYSQDDLLNALLDEDTTLLTNYLKASDNYHTTWYCAVFSGTCFSELERANGVMINLGKRQYGFFSHQSPDTAILNRFLSIPDNNCIGISYHPVSLEELPRCMKDCQIKAFHYFIQPDCSICSSLSDEKSQDFLNQVAGWLSVANSGQLLQSLENLKNSTQRNYFSVRTAMRLNNMICSSSSYGSQEDNYYIYSVQQMLDRYKSFTNLLDTLYTLVMEPSFSITESNQLSNINFLKMIEFLNQNYTRDISTNDLAEYMHLNPGYLSKIFKRETGTTVMKYITNLRILKSRQMLDSGNYSISEIASAIGFNDYFYFLKTFKKITGITPRQYQLGES